MMHFFRRSKIHLDCFTSRRDVIEYAPIVNGIEVIPDWWKTLPKSVINPSNGFSPAPTMKTCVGMYAYYNKSVALRMWTDMCINVYEDFNIGWQFADKQSVAVSHNKEQYEGFPGAKTHKHLKLDSPWYFKTKEDLNWLVTNPIYNRHQLKDYLSCQGFLNFKYQSSTNLQLFVDASTSRTYIIPFGSVFLLTPLTDKKVVIHRHLISKEAFNSINESATSLSFINKYKTQQKITQCPYKDETK
jgi:hypothetical protein